MSQPFGQDDGFFQGGYDHQQGGYDMSYTQSGNDFGQFDYGAQAGYDQSFQPQQQTYTGNILTPDQSAYAQPTGSADEEDYDNEPPLLEELGKQGLRISRDSSSNDWTPNE